MTVMNVYILFEDAGENCEEFLSVHRTADGAMKEGNEYLEKWGNTERFQSWKDKPQTSFGSIYIKEIQLED